MHVLILGGTSEASALAALIEKCAGINATFSLAGRTQNPSLPGIRHRVGGFGGADGLAQWLREQRVSALVDATHPFARVMPWNAAKAAHETGIPLLRLTRPGWQAGAGDDWRFVNDHAAAMEMLGQKRRRVFLTVGRLEIPAYVRSPQHFYLVRTIDPVEMKPLPDAQWLIARGPFTPEGEAALMRDHSIDVLITKDSGGSATGAKLSAARALGIPVILIRRPERPESESVTNAHAAMEWILRVHGTSL